MTHSNKYIVSDEQGNYVYYTDHYHEALGLLSQYNKDLVKHGINGSAAILKRKIDGNGRCHYELYY
ncbi:hypothetical protein [Legionella impletisoli]|uniref:Uncharacterized protein n=1 Tax=Legionella impletisoli TaxID=343510 RepID=A0A917JWE5_9GAMM|nr:hypothetical protein [Legionella impletisoli]GGI90569.1 hypothetical protein GCM10007966_19120 [Legionella impletisoli]